MKASSIRLFSLSLALIGLLLLALTAYKTVHLVDRGEDITLRTTALTVGQFLRSAGVRLGIEDRVLPPLQNWLSDGSTITIERAAHVVVRADGKGASFLSTERIPANLLEKASVQLFPGDQLLSQGLPVKPDLPLPTAAAYNLSIRRAVPVKVQEGDQVHTFYSTAPTLGQALWEAGILLRTADRLFPPADTPLYLNGYANPEIQSSTLSRSHDLTILIGKKQIEVRSAATRVGEALEEFGLSPQGLDYSLPSGDAPIPADGQIRLVRVRETVTIEQTPLPFKTEYQAASSLEIDHQSVINPGEYGLKANRVRVRYEDGKEISRQVEKEWVARQPQNKIIGYGTKVVMHSLKVPGGTIQYWRMLQMWATSYHPSETGDITASGLPLKKGVAAIDTAYIPFFTEMYIPSYGKALAADTGSGVKGRWIDLGYSDDNYLSWHQWVTVYFLWPPPANIVYIIP